MEITDEQRAVVLDTMQMAKEKWIKITALAFGFDADICGEMYDSAFAIGHTFGRIPFITHDQKISDEP